MQNLHSDHEELRTVFIILVSSLRLKGFTIFNYSVLSQRQMLKTMQYVKQDSLSFTNVMDAHVMDCVGFK